jgi:hypothetical protein
MVSLRPLVNGIGQGIQQCRLVNNYPESQLKKQQKCDGIGKRIVARAGPA